MLPINLFECFYYRRRYIIMYETHSQDEPINRGEALVYFIASGLAVWLLFFFLILNHFTRYLYIAIVGIIVWGVLFWFFIFEWKHERRTQTITNLFPENRKWYEVRPKRHTRRRLSTRKYYVQRSGTTLRIRTVYPGGEKPKHRLQTIEYTTFKNNYMLLNERTVQ